MDVAVGAAAVTAVFVTGVRDAEEVVVEEKAGDDDEEEEDDDDRR